MTIRLNDFMTKLPENQQQAIKKRAAELIAEEAKTHPPHPARESKERPQE